MTHSPNIEDTTNLHPWVAAEATTRDGTLDGELSLLLGLQDEVYTEAAGQRLGESAEAREERNAAMDALKSAILRRQHAIGIDPTTHPRASAKVDDKQ
jgi:hypothetical protein